MRQMALLPITILASASLGSAFFTASHTPLQHLSRVPRHLSRPGICSTRRHAAVHDKNEEFLEWAKSQGVVSPSLEIFLSAQGVRGVRATAALESGRPLITVPAKLTIETTTLSRTPPPSVPEGWVRPEAWREATWYVRLAVMLLAERDKGAASTLAPWVQSALPTPAEFADLPLYWSEAEVDALQYEPMAAAIDAQRAEYAQAYRAIAQAAQGAGASPLFDEAAFEWALHNVRSRAFSGVYEGSTWTERATQAGFTLVLAGGALLSGAASPVGVLNGVLAVGLTTVLRDLIMTSVPSNQKAQGSAQLKRYCLCPVVDMVNHQGGTPSDVSYEYFADGFALTVGKGFGLGDEVVISYGDARSNDQLLQFYGFVEPDNVSEQYEIRGLLELILNDNEARVAPGRLKQLQECGLLEFVRNGVATPGGFVDQSARAVRALVATDAEVAESGGVAALANRAGINIGWSGSLELDRRARACLSSACLSELSRLPTSAQEDAAALKEQKKNATESPERRSERARLALEYRLGKKRVLQRCAAALQAAAQ